MNIHPTSEQVKAERDRTGCGMMESQQRLLKRNALRALEHAERPSGELDEEIHVLKEIVRLMLKGEI